VIDSGQANHELAEDLRAAGRPDRRGPTLHERRNAANAAYEQFRETVTQIDALIRRADENPAAALGGKLARLRVSARELYEQANTPTEGNER
jgi:hypothetical protein